MMIGGKRTASRARIEPLAAAKSSKAHLRSKVPSVKKCIKCGIEKPLFDFAKDKTKKDGHVSTCKVCRKAYLNSFYSDTEKRLKKNEASRLDYHKNRDSILKKNKERYEKNIEAVRKRRKQQYWANPEAAKQYSKTYSLKRRWEDPVYRMVLRCRKRTWDAYQSKGYTKRSKTFDLIGCSHQDLKKHLESMFTDGMSWENYGEWHVDHKIPLASAKTEEDVARLCHYTNLQPLWAEDNLRKGARLDHGYHTNSR